MSDTFCSLPWLHFYKHMDDSVRLCCVDRGAPIGNLRDDDLRTIRNNDTFRSIRKNLLDGKRPERCGKCWDDEANGLPSYRTQSNKQYPLDPSMLTTAPEPIVYLDFRATNLCNLACKTCGPDYSSAWVEPFQEVWPSSSYQEIKKRIRAQRSLKQRLTDLEGMLPSLERIYFAGGEPILSADHWYILDELVKNDQTDVELVYNTNFTTLTFKNKNVIDYWKQFRSVRLCASLDGYGKSFEYMRTGAKWDDILTNARAVQNISSIHFSPSYTVGWMNLYSLPEFHQFLVNENLIKEVFDFGINIIYGPDGAQINECPPRMVAPLLTRMYEYRTWLSEKKWEHANTRSDFKWHRNQYDLLLSQVALIEKMLREAKMVDLRFRHWIKRCAVADKHFGTNLDMIWLDPETRALVETTKKDLGF